MTFYNPRQKYAPECNNKRFVHNLWLTESQELI